MTQWDETLDELISRLPALACVRGDIADAYAALEGCFESGGRLFICGNGGSAADALHITGELMKSFCASRPPDGPFARKLREIFPEQAEVLLSGLQGALPTYALVENSALSSAFANDVRPDMVFAQQVYGYAGRGDALLGISTSGESRNVVNALMVARAKGMRTIGLTGARRGAIDSVCDVTIAAPGTETYKIQEYHLPIYHTLCLMLERRFFGAP
jgi:D-sedoheptulose 7-phosphate isomerase